jgi:hypothetical protein
MRDFEAPTTSEGFSEIKTVNWVFEGDAEAKRRWGMWLQLDGENILSSTAKLLLKVAYQIIPRRNSL